MKITLLLIAICLLGFLYTDFFIGDPDGFKTTYGFSGQNMLERPYVLITSIFLHADLVHLISNIFVLFFFGMAVENELGMRKTLAMFFLGAFLGDIMSLFVYPFNEIGIGASAGIFALLGAGIIVRPVDISFYPIIVPIPLALLGLSYALYNLYGFFAELTGLIPATNISYIAHFGGLAVGLYYGFKIKGFKKSMRIITISLFAMIIIPILILLLFS